MSFSVCRLRKKAPYLLHCFRWLNQVRCVNRTVPPLVAVPISAYEKWLRKYEGDEKTVDRTAYSRHVDRQGIDDPSVKNQPLASRCPRYTHPAHGGPCYSVAHHGPDHITDRTFGIDVHATERSDKCGIYFLQPSDPGNTNIWAFCLRLGMPRRRSSGFLRLATKENGPDAEAIPFAATGFCSAARCVVYVRVADGQPGTY